MGIGEIFLLVMSHWPKFVSGMGYTLALTGFSLLLGLIIAVPCALILSFKVPYAQRAVMAYLYIFRGSPLLVQLFLIYYGVAQFDFIRNGPLWLFFREPFWCALLAFGLNTGAYTAHLLKGAIDATPIGEIEAARACGMKRFLQIRRIILPSSIRRAYPAYVNEIIFTLHGSALASTVQIMDLLGAGRWLNQRFYLNFEGFLVSGMLYASLTIIIIVCLRKIEHRLHRHLSPARS